MIQTAELKPKVMRMFGMPSASELSPQVMKDAIERVWNMVLLEMSQSATGYFAKFSDVFYLDADWTGLITIADLSVPIGVDFRNVGTDDAESAWESIDTASAENWQFYKDNNIPVALITGHAPQITVRTNFNPENTEFRLRYMSDGQAFDPTSQIPVGVELPQFFSPLFEYGVAMECCGSIVTEREEFKTQIPAMKRDCEMKFAEYFDQLKKWIRFSRAPKGITHRTPSNARRSRRFRSPNLGIPRY